MPRHFVVVFLRQAWQRQVQQRKVGQRQKEKAQALGFGSKSSDKHRQALTGN
jgi:hypothetical protein